MVKHTGCFQRYPYCQTSLLFIDTYPICHHVLIYLGQAAALKIIEKKVKQMSPRDKLCTLCMDAVSLKTHLFYNTKSVNIIGLEHFGLYRYNKVATPALVLLVRSISGNWKQPIAFYLVSGGCPIDELESIIRNKTKRRKHWFEYFGDSVGHGIQFLQFGSSPECYSWTTVVY